MSLQLAETALENMLSLDRLWGRASLGLALLSASQSKQPFRSAKQLASMAGVSEDTAMRDLRKLANIGRVERVEGFGSNPALYRCTDITSARTLSLLQALAASAEDAPDLSKAA